jgi:hypothetical protein
MSTTPSRPATLSLTTAQVRLAEDAGALVESLRRRARDLDEVVASFCKGHVSEDELRRAMRTAQLGG